MKNAVKFGAVMVAACAGTASVAVGAETILKNDRFPANVEEITNPQSVTAQVGFVTGEIGAAILPVPASVRPPIHIKRLQFMWLSTLNGQADPVVHETIVVYCGSVLQPGAQLIFNSAEDAGSDGLMPQMTDGFLNEFDFADENIILQTRPSFITVGLKFASDTNPSTGPSLVSDRPPGQPQTQTPGRNAIYGTWPETGINQTQWFQPLTTIEPFPGFPMQFGVSGNFFIRAVVEGEGCLADVAGPGQTSVPDGDLTADDIIAFVFHFFERHTQGDVAGGGQVVGPDGDWTADDIVVFVQRFFAGCD